jgi:hypothetical protein
VKNSNCKPAILMTVGLTLLIVAGAFGVKMMNSKERADLNDKVSEEPFVPPKVESAFLQDENVGGPSSATTSDPFHKLQTSIEKNSLDALSDQELKSYKSKIHSTLNKYSVVERANAGQLNIQEIAALKRLLGYHVAIQNVEMERLERILRSN